MRTNTAPLLALVHCFVYLRLLEGNNYIRWKLRVSITRISLIQPGLGGRVTGHAGAVREAFFQLKCVPFDSSKWAPALKSTTEAINARFLHLICRRPDGSGGIAAELNSELSDNDEWHAVGGADPARNPYMAATLQLRPGQDVVGTEIAHSLGPPNPDVHDILSRNDGPHFCAANIVEHDGTGWYLACLRSARQGEISDKDRLTFREIGRGTAQAVRAAAAIKNEGARLLAGACGALSITAFVLDAFGRVIAMSEKAEALVRRGEMLRLANGILQARSQTQTAKMDRAIMFAARLKPGSPPDAQSHIPLSDISGRHVAMAQAIPLPRDRCDIGLGAAALLIVDERMQSDVAALAAAHGLTTAETEVASLLVKRLRSGEIAERRGVSKETVRTQAKAIYAKLGIGGQSELVARFGGGKLELPTQAPAQPAIKA